MSTNRPRGSYGVQSPLQQGPVRGRDGHVPNVMRGFPPGDRIGEARERAGITIDQMHGSRVHHAGAMTQNMMHMEGFRSTTQARIQTPESPDTDDIPIGLGSGRSTSGIGHFGDVLGADHGSRYPAPALSFVGNPPGPYRPHAFPPRTSSLGVHSTPLLSFPELTPGFMAQQQESSSFASHRARLHQASKGSRCSYGLR